MSGPTGLRRHRGDAGALTAPGAALVRTISRFRSRARTAIFLRSALFTFAAVLGVDASVEYAWMSPLEPPFSWLAAAAIGIALGAAIALARTPTLPRVAARLDATLGLDDRVIAAFGMRRDPGPVATLVVRDALAGLDGVTPGRLFPVSAFRAAACAALAVVALLAVRTEEPAPSPAGSGRANAGTGGQLAGRGADVRRNSGAVTIDRSGASEGGDTGTRGPREGPFTPPLPSSLSNAQSAKTSPDRPGPTTAIGASSDAAGASPSPPSPRLLPEAIAAASAGTSVKGDGTGPARATGNGIGGTPGTGAGSAAMRAAATGAGGVAEGSLTGTTSLGAIGRVSMPGAAVVASSRQRAEAAITRGEVPPQHRAHVHDYFLAIQDGRRR